MSFFNCRLEILTVTGYDYCSFCQNFLFTVELVYSWGLVLCYRCTNLAVQKFAFPTLPDNNPANSQCLEPGLLFRFSLSPATLALLSRFSLPYWGQCSQQQQKSLAFLGDLFVQHVFCLSIPSNVKVCVKERGKAPVLSSGVDSWWLQCALASPGLQRAGIADSAQITDVHPFQNGQRCFEKEGSIYAHAWFETCKANGL